MKEECAFRATAAALLLAAAAVSSYHRHKAEAASPEKISATGRLGAILRLSRRRRHHRRHRPEEQYRWRLPSAHSRA